MSTFIRSRTYLIFLALALCATHTHKAEAGNNPLQRSYQSNKLVRPPIPQTESGGIRCTKARYVRGEKQIGLASWYGNSFHGKVTASGEIFNENSYTVAHLTLPMGTTVLVESLVTGKTALARVTDCGPYLVDRIVDLSKGLASHLGIKNTGISQVIIHVL